MKFAKVIRKVIDRDADGISVRGGINAAVSGNVNEPGHTVTTVHSESHVVQDSRSGRPRPSTTEETNDG